VPLPPLDSKLSSIHASYQLVCQQVEQEEKALARSQQRVSNLQEAQQLIQQLAEQVQNQVHRKISHVVTRCLKTIFVDEAPDFKISFVRARGKTEARLLFVQDGHELDPLDSHGGGLIDVASFALRIACLMLSRPPHRKVIIGDENFRFVNGEEYQERMGELLMTLAKELGFQFILVSDDSWLKHGKVIDLEELEN